MPEKQRLDILVAARGLAESREMARRFIMAGEISVNGQLADKPGQKVDIQAEITLKAAPKFVSRGGDKLDAALTAFNIATEAAVCADLGASTGGFTDCLLQRGAAKVYAIDVGYGQLDYRLRNNPRVIVMERTNARHIQQLPEPVSVVSIDASFISLRILLPVVRGWLAASAEVVPLIKPQFEAGKQDVGKGGVVKSPEVHARILREIITAAAGSGFVPAGLILSPLKGPAGNIEFLAWLRWNPPNSIAFDLELAIAEALPKPAP
jgi:23S rRNA (cytidine1920-2'-O)/16S rRNA (cytidine1409-2'-O)-methyltransferase